MKKTEKFDNKEAKYKAELKEWIKKNPGQKPPQLDQLIIDIQVSIDKMSEKQKTFICKDCGQEYIAKTLMQFHECPHCGSCQHDHDKD